jgi:hypothetical protein
VTVVAIYDACRHRYAAVRLLVTRGFGSEAVGPATAIYRDALLLIDLADATPDMRARQLAGLDQDGVERAERLLPELQHSSTSGSHAEKGEAAPLWRPDYDAIARRAGIAREWASAQLAAHATDHPAIASRARYSRVSEDTVMVGGPHATEREMDKVAIVIATEALLRATRAVCIGLDWPEPGEVSTALTTLESWPARCPTRNEIAALVAVRRFENVVRDSRTTRRASLGRGTAIAAFHRPRLRQPTIDAGATAPMTYSRGLRSSSRNDTVSS